MKITGPLVVDTSLWVNHLNTQELIDGGVVSIIVGLYKQWNAKTQKYDLHPNCQRQIDQVVNSSLLLQAYYYYYPQYDPIVEANWFIDQIKLKTLPVKFCWCDLEEHPWNITPLLLSEQYRRFTLQTHNRFPPRVLYCRLLINGYAPEMNKWLSQYLQWVPKYGHEPDKKQLMTWDQLKVSWLPDYDISLAAGAIA